jgi:hypothetical protein
MSVVRQRRERLRIIGDVDVSVKKTTTERVDGEAERENPKTVIPPP